ncbi:hypothetical protein VTG60DRAFT_6490 [Thermothelomyces hinnuleus]
MMETFDVVVGAGVFGLCVAKTIHQLYPEKSLVILDSGSTLGGVWSQSRLYPGLKTNNMLGTMEYPDFPMDSDTFGLKPGEHLAGEVMFEYLRQYAERFGILNKIRYDSVVTTARHQDSGDGGWILTVQNSNTRRQVFARKLIMAAGLTSEAFLPHIKGQEQFGVPIFHSKDFAKHVDILDSAARVTVFGGTKSAWDVVYAYASRGIKVDWVIRATGHGPIWISPPYVTPFKKWLEKLVHTRLLTWFSPCIWGDTDGYGGIRRFLHGTAIGRAITNAFWSMIGDDVLARNKYDSHPELRKLKPWSPAMFTASSFSILNYPIDIFDLVRDGTIRVHIADLTGLSARTVHLSDGTQLDADALCCATGWKHVPPIEFLPEGIDRELGLPHGFPDSDLFTPQAIRQADDAILTRFPRLRDQPVQNRNLKPLLAYGARFPDFVFDAVPYIDLLLGDLGLRMHRKRGWLREMTEPYGPEDYRDLVGEFVASVGEMGS